MSNKRDFMYAAGFVDADGYVTLHRVHRNKFRIPYVQITNVDRGIIEFFQTTFGGRIRTRKGKGKNHNDYNDWFVVYDAALEFLQEIYPYMKHTKKMQRARMILGEYKVLTPRNGKYSDIAKKRKMAFENKVMSIKMRGVDIL